MASPFTPPTIPGAQGYPLGLTGTTAATRYVGATTSGAPASGTFAVGDESIDQTGRIYICTVAGSPGTWVQVGSATGGSTLDYAEDTTAKTISATVEASADTIVTAAARTYDGSTVIMVEFCCHAVTIGANAAGNVLVFNLWDGSTDLGRIGVASYPANGAPALPVHTAVRLTPSAASHTYSARAWRTNANCTVDGSTPRFPTFIRSLYA